MTKIGKSIELKLPCVLTERELQSRSMMLVETIAAVDETESARSAAMKGFKETLTGLSEQQRTLARTLRTGIEERLVECTVLFHTPAEATKRIVRMDTGEVVREEAMTAAECQINMFAAQAEFEEFMKAAEAEIDPDPPATIEEVSPPPPPKARKRGGDAIGGDRPQ